MAVTIFPRYFALIYDIYPYSLSTTDVQTFSNNSLFDDIQIDYSSGSGILQCKRISVQADLYQRHAQTYLGLQGHQRDKYVVLCTFNDFSHHRPLLRLLNFFLLLVAVLFPWECWTSKRMLSIKFPTFRLCEPDDVEYEYKLSIHSPIPLRILSKIPRADTHLQCHHLAGVTAISQICVRWKPGGHGLDLSQTWTEYLFLWGCI